MLKIEKISQYVKNFKEKVKQKKEENPGKSLSEIIKIIVEEG
jgi:mRNA-degrading endonuclease YafQ of YafQ-DinJ toxin-antitoxin module